MTSEKVKVEARQKHLNVMEILLNRKQATIDKLDVESQMLLVDTKDLYTAVEARANATIKLEEDLTVRTLVVCEQERAVAELEQDLWDKDEAVDYRR
jgi:hypothetical protein